jgi:hypothetical protein
MGLLNRIRALAEKQINTAAKMRSPTRTSAPSPRISIGKCEACGRDIRVRGGNVSPGTRLTCRCGHVTTFGVKPAKEKPLRRKRPQRLDGILIIFTKDFEPKGTFVNSILTKMTAHNKSYKEWMKENTPVKIFVHPQAQNPNTFLALAMVQFKTMGIEFSAENLEQATFEGSEGISGTVVTHWSS